MQENRHMQGFDFITKSIVSFNDPTLTIISTALDNDIIFVLFMIFAVIINERRFEKIKKITIALIIALILSSATKELFKVQRPCIEEETDKIQCPISYSFPSTHAALAFTLALAFLNKRSYVLYLMLALFVSFTRIYLFVHTFIDITGGFIIAGLAYYIIDLAFNDKIKNNGKIKKLEHGKTVKK